MWRTLRQVISKLCGARMRVSFSDSLDLLEFWDTFNEYLIWNLLFAPVSIKVPSDSSQTGTFTNLWTIYNIHWPFDMSFKCSGNYKCEAKFEVCHNAYLFHLSLFCVLFALRPYFAVALPKTTNTYSLRTILGSSASITAVSQYFTLDSLHAL